MKALIVLAAIQALTPPPTSADALAQAAEAASVNVTDTDGERQAVLIVPAVARSPRPAGYCMTNPLVEEFRSTDDRRWRGALIDTRLDGGLDGRVAPAVVRILLTVEPGAAGVRPGLVCMPATTMVAGRSLRLAGFDATTDPHSTVFRGLWNVGTLFVRGLFGSPVARYTQVFIASSPAGLEIMLDGNVLTSRTDAALAVNEAQRARLFVRAADGRRMPLRACDRRPPPANQGAIAYSCRFP